MPANLLSVPPDERPRERLLAYGPEHLSDVELLTVLIGSGTKGNTVTRVAAEVLLILDRRNGDIDVDSFAGVKGMGSIKAAQLAAAFELSRRRLCPGQRKITYPSDVVPIISHFADRNQEHFLCLALNGAHEVLNIRVVSMGLLNRTIVHPREVFADPLKDRAAAVVVAHNHPSGNVEPSREDRQITTRLKEAGEMLGIQLLDHIIFSVRGYYSFLEKGEL
ncbi:MAG TPA: DNA repair protein RadC [Spirochaetia bacterium]|nr:DNA repair protein RadC [Spirochaetia bacterium]